MKYARVLHDFYSTPWAIQPEKLRVMAQFLQVQAAGVKFDPAEIQARIGAAHQPVETRSSAGVAVVPVYGVIAQRMDLFSEISGGTSTQRLAQDIRSAAANPDVDTILLDVDSPGGSVYGVQELADVIYQLRDQVRIVAIANSLMASAAYWIGSAAEELVITPGGEAGSIGVITAHENYQPLIEDRKLPEVEFVYAGKYKAEGNMMEPLGDEARAALQARIDDYYAAFTEGVARNRGVSVQTVIADFGQGRVLGAQAAVDAGLADRIATFDDLTGELVAEDTSLRRRRDRMRSSAETLAKII